MMRNSPAAPLTPATHGAIIFVHMQAVAATLVAKRSGGSSEPSVARANATRKKPIETASVTAASSPTPTARQPSGWPRVILPQGDT